MVEGTRGDFYWGVLTALRKADVPFMVGGAFAMSFYAGIHRDTKDMDLFVHPRNAQSVAGLLMQQGYAVEVASPYWLVKVTAGEDLVDFIFGSMNGVGTVDDGWLEHAPQGVLMGMAVKVVPVEEMVWSKAFVMTRDRYDGADISHLLLRRGREMDWRRLLERFGEHWPVLLGHLILFSYTYPSEHDTIPQWLERELVQRWQAQRDAEPPSMLCRGTMLSHLDFRTDVEQWGYLDARLAPFGRLTPEVLPERGE